RQPVLPSRVRRVGPSSDLRDPPRRRIPPLPGSISAVALVSAATLLYPLGCRSIVLNDWIHAELALPLPSRGHAHDHVWGSNVYRHHRCMATGSVLLACLWSFRCGRPVAVVPGRLLLFHCLS